MLAVCHPPGVNKSCALEVSPPLCVRSWLLCGFACKFHRVAAFVGNGVSICMLCDCTLEGGNVYRHPAVQFSLPNWIATPLVCRVSHFSLPSYHLWRLSCLHPSECGRPSAVPLVCPVGCLVLGQKALPFCGVSHRSDAPCLHPLGGSLGEVAVIVPSLDVHMHCCRGHRPCPSFCNLSFPRCHFPLPRVYSLRLGIL